MAVAAECPYFKYEKAGVTHCECGDLIFPDTQTRREIIYNYCAHPTDFRKCPFYVALEHYYERKYNNDTRQKNSQTSKRT